MRIHQNRGSSWSSVAPGGPAQAWAPLIGEPRKGAPRAQLESQLLPTAALLVHVHLEPVSKTLALRQRQSGIRSPSDSEHRGRPASASGRHLPPGTEFLSPALTHLWGPGDSAGQATEDCGQNVAVAQRTRGCALGARPPADGSAPSTRRGPSAPQGHMLGLRLDSPHSGSPLACRRGPRRH